MHDKKHCQLWEVGRAKPTAPALQAMLWESQCKSLNAEARGQPQCFMALEDAVPA